MTDFQDKKLTEVLDQILVELKNVSQYLISIDSSLADLKAKSSKNSISESSDLTKAPMLSSLDILNLQESRPGIFKTYKALQKKGDWVKSSDILEETGRSRGLESRYLNYLAEKGFVLKKREKMDLESKATEVWYKIIGAND
ncbi:MAG: hypothetical protein KAT16_03680 [Candidatus Heimdallarchaeota archaeon]|nr:hypothetical protein [Candidatus Heimdallarchaeota archaeon]